LHGAADKVLAALEILNKWQYGEAKVTHGLTLEVIALNIDDKAARSAQILVLHDDLVFIK